MTIYYAYHINFRHFQKEAYSTKYSQVVTHPITNSAQFCLTSIYVAQF